jgi:metallo-beta-lactamase family protein
MKITFLGAAGEVTGSQHLIETDSRRILLDCGLFQGRDSETRPKNAHFRCRPRKLDAVILSHAHIDHCGNLPGLYKAGFRREPIFCTRATADIASIMMRDSAKIQEEDARYLSKKNKKRGNSPVEPLYTEDEAKGVSKLFEYVAFDEWEELGQDVRLRFHHAGHILGSAITELELLDEGTWKRIVFTGDLGRRNKPILPDPDTVERCDAVISESTYGDRVHPTTDDVKSALHRIICDAAARGGRVIIPAFSLGRTQLLVYLLNELRNENALCRVPVFIDSPLATRLTDVFRDHVDIMDDEARETLKFDDDIFGFDGLTFTRGQGESMALNRRKGAFVVIAASGMCTNGRIVHHLKHAVDNPNNTIVIIGYQAAHTLGRQIVERREEVRIFGRSYPLTANVEIINGLSAHADADDFRWWFGELAKNGGTGQVFLVHGEERGTTALSDIVTDCSDNPPIVPQFGQSFEV